MNYDLLLLIIVGILYLCFCVITENYDNYDLDREGYYVNFMNEYYQKMFPNRNRNAGGPMFYKQIYDISEQFTEEEFHLHNTFYCGVSGSVVKREDQYDYIKVKGIDGNEYYGKYYRCCWPCLCDIMKYVYLDTHTVKLKDKEYEHYVLVIGDPCNKELPEEVNGYNCMNKKTENGIRTNNGHLIIAVLHDVEIFDESKHDIEDVMSKCKERMSTEPDNLKGGMGDIFVKLSLNNEIKELEKCYNE